MTGDYRRYFALLIGTHDREYSCGKTTVKVDYEDRLAVVYPDGSVCWRGKNRRFDDKQLQYFDNYLISAVEREMKTVEWALQEAKETTMSTVAIGYGK